MAALHVELVAADRMVWQGEAKLVTARGIDGDLGIMPDHAPLLTALAGGEVAITDVEGVRQTAVVDGGFLSVDSNVVTIVAENVDTAGTTAPSRRP